MGLVEHNPVIKWFLNMRIMHLVALRWWVSGGTIFDKFRALVVKEVETGAATGMKERGVGDAMGRCISVLF